MVVSLPHLPPLPTEDLTRALGTVAQEERGLVKMTTLLFVLQPLRPDLPMDAQVPATMTTPAPGKIPPHPPSPPLVSRGSSLPHRRYPVVVEPGHQI